MSIELLSMMVMVSSISVSTEFTTELERPCLEQADSIFSVPNYQANYHSAVRAKLLSDQGVMTPRFRVVALPAFSEEWMVDIRYSDDEPYIYYVHLDKQLWPVFACNSEEIKELSRLSGVPDKELHIECESVNAVSTTIHKAAISTELANSLEEILLQILHENRPRKRIGKDGTNYFFVSGWHSGRTWSPPGESVAQYLVEIAELLASITKSPEAERAKIVEEIEKRVVLLSIHAIGHCTSEGV